MKDKKTYIILGVSILFIAIGISFAYFSLNVIGNDTAKNNKIVTGNLELTFTDTEEISLNNMFPGDSVTKTIKVTNTGTKEVAYNVGWTDYENGIINNELIIEGTCKRLNSSNTEEGTCDNISKKAITGSNVISNISIEPNVTHEYTLTITFKETNKPQNYNKNKSFNGKLNITESTAKTVYCTFDGELTQAAEYVNGQYTYRYMQEFDYDDSDWINITTDGWGVQLTDRDSTEPVTSKFCTYINDKPVVSMSCMFADSIPATLDLSNFDTSNVVSMKNMFNGSQATTLDVSSFDTSNVTNMSMMFYNSEATTLDLSNFDTSKVTDMSDMFNSSSATIIKGLENFDTSNVTNMSCMFCTPGVTTLDVSNFDTSNVTDMSMMFSGSKVTTLDVSNFDTSNVTMMNRMFDDMKVTTLDLSSFDTSKVTSMLMMFANSTNLKTIYVSDKFKTDTVTDSTRMFYNCTNLVGGKGTKFDSTIYDKTYARIDGGSSNPGYFTSK